MANESRYLRIGELARRTGTSPELLRAWEQRYGLLRPSRSAGGFRLYSDDDKARILRTKQLIASGLSAGEAARQAVTGECHRGRHAGPRRPRRRTARCPGSLRRGRREPSARPADRGCLR